MKLSVARQQLVISACSLAPDVLLSTFSDKEIDLLFEMRSSSTSIESGENRSRE